MNTEPSNDPHPTADRKQIDETLDIVERAFVHLTSADEGVLTSHNSEADDGSVLNPANPNGPAYDPKAIAQPEPEVISRSGLYAVASSKSFSQASADLQASVIRNEFGVLHIHDLGSTLRSKGIDFGEECHVFEVCHPAQAATILDADMALNMALPCRISVYTDGGATRLGLVRPAPLLAMLSDDPALSDIAQHVESALIRMVDEAK
jgi:uncharacterized protein (DUF302 family)